MVIWRIQEDPKLKLRPTCDSWELSKGRIHVALLLEADRLPNTRISGLMKYCGVNFPIISMVAYSEYAFICLPLCLKLNAPYTPLLS
jgi:hypothetical protein